MIKVRLQDRVISMRIQLLALAAALIVVAGCTTVQLPFVAPINELDAPKVRWSLPTKECSYPSLTLVNRSSGEVLCRTPSVFNQNWVASMGVPEGDTLTILRSPTNKTILVHECASESSPHEHLVIFSCCAEGVWTSYSTFPPSRPTALYGTYATSRGIDDESLYYQFDDGKLLRTRFTELEPMKVEYP